MSRTSLVLACGLLLWGAATTLAADDDPAEGAAAALADEGDPAAGRAFAEAQCARCHAVAEAGVSPMAEAPPLRVLPSRYPVEALAEAFAEGIVVGHSAMPQFELAPQEIADLLAYIDSLAE